MFSCAFITKSRSAPSTAGWPTAPRHSPASSPNSFFGAIRAFIFIALYHARGEIAGYDLTDAITFVALGQGILMVLYLWGWWEIAETIKTGSVVSDLSRPYDYYAYWLARDMGRAVYHLIARGVTSFVVIALIFGARLPASLGQWLLFAFSLVLATVTSFAFRFILNVSAFWLLDVRGVGGAATIAATLFSGFEVPLVYFPGWLRSISDILPFRGMMQTPADVFLGPSDGHRGARRVRAAGAVVRRPHPRRPRDGRRRDAQSRRARGIASAEC